MPAYLEGDVHVLNWVFFPVDEVIKLLLFSFFFLKVWSAAALTPATRTWVAPPLWPNRLWTKAWSVKHSSQSPPAQSRFVPPLREMDMWVSAHGSSRELHFHYSSNSLKQSKFNPFFCLFLFSCSQRSLEMSEVWSLQMHADPALDSGTGRCSVSKCLTALTAYWKKMCLN